MSEKQPKQWIIGDEFIAPPQDTALVTVTVTQGYRSKIKGFWLSVNDPAGNIIKISWKYNGKDISQTIILSSVGTIFMSEDFAINDSYPADPQSSIIISNTVAGTAGKKYQASLLTEELPI